MVMIYAHRGASAESAENTLPAFERAMELGAYGIELDVHLSADGVPVVIHDETVDRTTNGSGAVAGLTVADLRQLDAGGAPVPTLAEVLDLIGDRLHVDIEVKAGAAADAVLEETRQRPRLRYAMSSFDHDVLRYARKSSAEVELWPLTVGATDDALAAAAELASPCIAIYDRFVNADIVDYLRRQGRACWVWTVNDPERAATLVEWSVAGLCTDDPRALMERLGS